jgi:hypothetical protein
MNDTATTYDEAADYAADNVANAAYIARIGPMPQATPTPVVNITISLRTDAVAVVDQLAKEWGVEREAAANLCIIWGVRPAEIAATSLNDPARWRPFVQAISVALRQRGLLRTGHGL